MAKATSNVFALLIGIDTYQNPKLNKSKVCVNNVDEFDKYLKNRLVIVHRSPRHSANFGPLSEPARHQSRSMPPARGNSIPSRPKRVEEARRAYRLGAADEGGDAGVAEHS
jgi:hypothetical protein